MPGWTIYRVVQDSDFANWSDLGIGFGEVADELAHFDREAGLDVR